MITAIKLVSTKPVSKTRMIAMIVLTVSKVEDLVAQVKKMVSEARVKEMVPVAQVKEMVPEAQMKEMIPVSNVLLNV